MAEQAHFARFEGSMEEHKKHVDKSITDLWNALDKISAKMTLLFLSVIGVMGTGMGVFITQLIILSRHGN